MALRKSFYIRWSAGRSPRVHEVNPGRDPSSSISHLFQICESLIYTLFFIASKLIVKYYEILKLFMINCILIYFKLI